MFGGKNSVRCRKVVRAALLAGLIAASSSAGVFAQTSSADPWESLSGEEQIRRFYLPRAAAGDATAQYYLGHMYQNGLGVAADKEAAADWYGRAAAQDDPRALYRLGVMLQTGDGITKDLPTAFAMYRRAAEQGVLEAFFNMAQMVEDGEGTAGNLELATGMFEQLARAGMTEAMRELGRIAAQKEDRDLVTAWYWFALASTKGDAQAGELARLIAGNMSAEQLSAAQKRLSEALKN